MYKRQVEKAADNAVDRDFTTTRQNILSFAGVTEFRITGKEENV